MTIGLVVAACSSTTEERAATVHESIVGGTADPGDPAVVYVLALGPGGTAAAGTGTIVSPHMVLTAAHVVTLFATSPVASFRVFIDSDRPAHGSDPANWLSVREAHADPLFDRRFMGNGHDVGVLILDSATEIAPLPIHRAPVDSSWIGTPIRSVGYGVTSSDDTTNATLGLRREGTSAITSVGSFFLGSVTGGDQQPCAGDSGGPGLVTIDGVEMVAGVVSNGDPTCTSAAFARVDVSAPFVDQWIAQVDSRAGQIDGGNDVDATTEVTGMDEDAALEEADGGDIDAPDGGDDPMSNPSSPHSGCVMSHTTRGGSSWLFAAAMLAVIRRRRRLFIKYVPGSSQSPVRRRCTC